MKSTDVNLTSLQNQPSSSDEPEPTKLQNIQQLLTILSQILANKYQIDKDESLTMAKHRFDKIKNLSLYNPDKVIRTFNIFPLSDENICKHLIEKEK
ncbi:MAG: hypothetical protein ACI4N3_02440 [Alphaproteobacteria bacterium]